MNDPIKLFCLVCGKQIPIADRAASKKAGAMIEIEKGHSVYVCPSGHTEEEIIRCAIGVPKFKRASEIKRGLL